MVRLRGITAKAWHADYSPRACRNGYAAKGVDVMRLSPPEKPKGYSEIGRPKAMAVSDSDNGDNETRVIPVDSLCQSVAVICGHDQVRAGASGYWWQFGFVYD